MCLVPMITSSLILKYKVIYHMTSNMEPTKEIGHSSTLDTHSTLKLPLVIQDTMIQKTPSFSTMLITMLLITLNCMLEMIGFIPNLRYQLVKLNISGCFVSMEIAFRGWCFHSESNY
jgi:hypothetical protein